MKLSVKFRARTLVYSLQSTQIVLILTFSEQGNFLLVIDVDQCY